MSTLPNPGIITLTTAYRTTNPVIPGSVSTNGYVDGVIGTALGSVAPVTPVFDGMTVAANFEYVDAAGKSHIVFAVAGAQLATAIDRIYFTFNGVTYNLFANGAAFSTTLVAGYSVWDWTMTANILGIVPQSVVVTIEDLTDDFNCDCVTGSESVIFGLSTMAALTTRFLIRTGYAAQAANPPAGMLALAQEYLSDAQTQLNLKFNNMNGKRFFKWTMQPGQRYYGLAKSEGGCGVQLDPYQITWAGFEDLNQAWYDLEWGIPPVSYTRAQLTTGWPSRIEVRQCIEIFPAPQAKYTLWIEGFFIPAAFAAPADVCAFDSELILLLAVGNAKTDLGKPGAQLALSQASSRFGKLVAATHQGRRYVPGPGTPSPLTPPKFPLIGPQ